MTLSYLFLHNEWNDICTIDETLLKINRTKINNEYGAYNIENNKIIINWYNWKGNDIFFKYNDIYYNENFYNNYIKNYELNNCIIIIDNVEKEFILNLDKNIIFDKYNNKNIGIFELNINYLIIELQNLNINNKFIKLNEKYYEEETIIKLINKSFSKNNYKNNNFQFNESIPNDLIEPSEKISVEHENTFLQINQGNTESSIVPINIEKFIKINNKYYYSKLDSISNIELNKNIYSYYINNYSNLKIENIYNNIFLNIKNLINKEKINNNKNNYLNLVNLEEYLIKYFKNNNIFDTFLKIDLNFNIPDKKLKRILTLVEWGYPPFGGGENWILDLNKILFKNNYETYLICFYDPYNEKYFDKINFIELDYVKIIQMPMDIILIIKIIKIINPNIINHQGLNRLFFMKISNLLKIPFLTGFCFWQNIIKMDSDNINVNMKLNNKLEKTAEFDIILKNSYTYCSSTYVNDIIFKFYKINLDIIETISLEDNFIVENNFNNNIEFSNRKYVTLINCHYNKGGYLIEYLCKNLDYNIALQFIYTENDKNITINYIENLINLRNNINNINIFIQKKVDIKEVYKKTRILLIPSLCDETFCRVAYEGMNNSIPILSTKNGNLNYLLKEYAIFIDDYDTKEWKNKIENIYYDQKMIVSFEEKYKNKNKNKNQNQININYIEKKIINKINGIEKSKYKLENKNIGLIIPWCDQGLGIQGRDYYITLKLMGYNPCVLSFKPYNSINENEYLQSDKNEWQYDNITYSKNNRDKLNYDEIFEFIHKNNIGQVIIIEATFNKIFEISLFIKLLNIKIYLVINIECIRLNELPYHYIYDKILTNNNNSFLIIKDIFKDNVEYLGFHLNHPYFKNLTEIKKNNFNFKNIKFLCIGGMNSITRKNIDKIIETYYNIYNDDLYLNWTLNIYIQGKEIPNILNSYKCKNINFYITHLSYKEIIDKYIENDIFIHLGSHEGLGLGFYESLYCGTPILTINSIPNNEIIINNINGWLFENEYIECNDNNNALINMAKISNLNLKNKIEEIINDKNNTLQIINNTINNIKNTYNINKMNFENNLKNILN